MFRHLKKSLIISAFGMGISGSLMSVSAWESDRPSFIEREPKRNLKQYRELPRKPIDNENEELEFFTSLLVLGYGVAMSGSEN